MKAERVQFRSPAVTRDRLQKTKLDDGWELDVTPNAITRHFPQPGFSASAAFVTKLAKQAEKHERAPWVVVSEAGVTVRLGNPPQSGVTEADVALALEISRIS